MWIKKNQLALIVVVLLVVVGVYFGSMSTESNLRDKMLDAVADHDHENALVYATDILKHEPTNREAKRVISESGQIFYYLQAAKSTLTEFMAGKDDATIDAKQLYEQFDKAREYTGKAKALDPRFRTVSNFEKTLDKSQTTLIHILSLNVFEQGQSVVERAGANYRKTSEIVDVATSSRYLSTFLPYQSAWASVNTPIEEIKEELSSSLNEMDEIGRLISTYREGSAKDFTMSLLTYISVVKTTADTLLVPKGSYKDFSKAANLATSEYKKIRTKVKRATPRSTSGEGAMVSLLKGIPEYQISRNRKVDEIVTTNQSLYKL